MLTYENLGNDEEKFRLKSLIQVYKPKENKSLFSISPNVQVVCDHASSEPLSQEEWAKDDYLMIKSEMASMFSACEEKVVAELPALLAS